MQYALLVHASHEELGKGLEAPVFKDLLDNKLLPITGVLIDPLYLMGGRPRGKTMLFCTHLTQGVM